MSVTIPISEAGVLQLPEFVRKSMGLQGACNVRLDVEDSRVTLQPEQPVFEHKLVWNGRRMVIAGGPPLGPTDIIDAIAEDQDERTDAILAYRNKA